ncbi:hypothetical protein HYQ43_13945 [Paracoccus pantotrophus]|jgi:hypothetical protein|uniref:Uncharacterized protein n=1 Tax=Paracoccus pantotrophus TaxID=82367 RepID=A0A7H9BX10_PARPN|nr:hypothetical protein [Paracoccus pantotrophus]QLH15296.1 hypothetical protein HYQ43_13945 [Paracoccus pantotrophus]
MTSHETMHATSGYRRKGPDYLNSPDMVAFTIGRVVMAKMTAGRPLSWNTLRARLMHIAEGDTVDLPAGVNTEMALAALRYLPALPEVSRFKG